MPSYLDLAVLGIVLVSALLSMMRGFTREVLAIASWAAAAAAAYYFYPMVMPYLTPYIHKEIIAQAAAAAHRVLRDADRRVADHGPAVRRDPRQQGRRARPLAGLPVRRGAGLSPCGRRLRDLQLAGPGEAAAGMGQERQDAAAPHRDGRSNRRHAADGRGGRRSTAGSKSRATARRRTSSPTTTTLAPEDRRRSTDRRRPRLPRRRPKKADSDAGSSGGSAMDKQKLDALINKNASLRVRPRSSDRARCARMTSDPAGRGADFDLDERPAARGMRRLRHLRPSRRRRDHRARAARAAASRPGSGRHRRLRRRRFHSERRLGLVGDHFSNAATIERLPGRVGDRPCALFDDRRDHPAQRPAAVRRTRRRRLRGRA